MVLILDAVEFEGILTEVYSRVLSIIMVYRFVGHFVPTSQDG